MGRRKTHEEFVKELYEINPNIEILSKYEGSSIKVKCRCRIDGTIFFSTPNNLLRGHGCPLCGRKNIIEKQKMPQEEFLKKMKDLHPDIIVVGEYINSKTKILCKCKIDGFEWYSTPQDLLLNKRGCPKCKGIIYWTTKTFKEEMSIRNPDIIILGEYINSKTKILCKCKIDGFEWESTPSDLLQGHGCPMCGGVARWTPETFRRRMQEINSNIIVIGDYVTNTLKILCKCKIDGFEWESTPSDLLQGRCCPQCANNKKGKYRLKTHEQFIEELYKINSNIEILEEYINSKTKILCMCKIDGNIWNAIPTDLLRGHGCPECAKKSKGELAIKNILDTFLINYTPQYKFKDCKDKLSLPFDFYISDFNVCVEYDGIQHFEVIDFAGKGEEWAKQQFETTQLHDKIKNEYCTENNIKLLRIPYWEYDNIENILFDLLLEVEAIELVA